MSNKTFWIFYFLWVFGFLTHKKEKIDLKQPCKNIWCKTKQTASLQLKQPTSTLPNKGSINAWICCNAYAWVPFFTHTSRTFGVISLWDWVRKLGHSNLLEKLSKQLVNAPIIFITFIIPESLFRSLDDSIAQVLLSFLGPLDLWSLAFLNTLNLWQLGRVCPWSLQWWHRWFILGPLCDHGRDFALAANLTTDWLQGLFTAHWSATFFFF